MLDLSPRDPLASELARAVQGGDLEALTRLLNDHPQLTSVRIRARDDGWRTALHLATDWPGYFPDGPAIVRLLIDAGADPNAPSADRPSETPLHWAASTDDVEVAAALIDAGADVTAPGSSIAGGAPLQNAVGYGCWQVARLLVASGAPVDAPWQAAALGMTDHVRAWLHTGRAPSQAQLDEAFWQACHGGQLRTAQLLLAHGANPDGRPDYSNGLSPLEIAGTLDEARQRLSEWLRRRDVNSTSPPHPA